VSTAAKQPTCQVEIFCAPVSWRQFIRYSNRLPALLAYFVYGADVRMVQRGRSLRLALKSFECTAIMRHLLGEELKRHEPVQACVLSLIDDTHASAAELFDDAVMRDGLASHRETIALFRES
jgi:hypothetical protein